MTKHVLIIGGGFVGLNVAKMLGGGAEAEVTLVDRQNLKLSLFVDLLIRSRSLFNWASGSNGNVDPKFRVDFSPTSENELKYTVFIRVGIYMAECARES